MSRGDIRCLDETPDVCNWTKFGPRLSEIGQNLDPGGLILDNRCPISDNRCPNYRQRLSTRCPISDIIWTSVVHLLSDMRHRTRLSHFGHPLSKLGQRWSPIFGRRVILGCFSESSPLKYPTQSPKAFPLTRGRVFFFKNNFFIFSFIEAVVPMTYFLFAK